MPTPAAVVPTVQTGVLSGEELKFLGAWKLTSTRTSTTLDHSLGNQLLPSSPVSQVCAGRGVCCDRLQIAFNLDRSGLMLEGLHVIDGSKRLSARRRDYQCTWSYQDGELISKNAMNVHGSDLQQVLTSKVISLSTTSLILVHLKIDGKDIVRHDGQYVYYTFTKM